MSTQKKSVEAVSKELEDHFAEEAAKTDPFSMKVVKFDVHQRGSLAMIKLPYRSDQYQFGVACREIQRAADLCQVRVMFFDSRSNFESFKSDNDFELKKLGLQRIPK